MRAIQYSRDERRTYNSSYAGLTRVSIDLRKSLAKRIDGRVKPGHDELRHSKRSWHSLTFHREDFLTNEPYGHGNRRRTHKAICEK
jgi:hypothetical protein